MPREIYHTEGITLSYINVGEAERLFFVYTKDYGLLKIFAQGIRLSKSKLARHVTLFSHSRISFVYGRDILRLTDAEIIHLFSRNSFSFASAGNISSFLTRVVRGEEQDQALWMIISSAFYFLSGKSSNTASEKGYFLAGDGNSVFHFFEILFSARVLHCLGYVGGTTPFIKEIIERHDWALTRDMQNKLFPLLNEIVSRGLRVSQL